MLEKLHAIREAGISLSLTISAPLFQSYICIALPIDRTQAGQELRPHIETAKDARALIHLVLRIGTPPQHEVAEGVENEAQRLFSRRPGCEVLPST